MEFHFHKMCQNIYELKNLKQNGLKHNISA